MVVFDPGPGHRYRRQLSEEKMEERTTDLLDGDLSAAKAVRQSTISQFG